MIRPEKPAEERLVVLDLETSGLDVRKDWVIAIGAVAICGDAIRLSDSFELIVQPLRTSAKENILIHQIGAEAQMKGVDPALACQRFLDYLGKSPIVAFRAGFDREFLTRAIKTSLGRRFDHVWLDLAELAPAVFPMAAARNLDEWLLQCGVPVEQERHHACLDALVCAQLFLKLRASLAPSQRSFRELSRLAKDRRWLGRPEG